MVKAIKYSLSLLLIIVLVIGVIYYFYFKREIKVTFNSNGGSVVAPINVNLKGQISEPTAPTKEGYVFDGWYLNDLKFNFDSSINENVTLTAHWLKKEEISYILAFDSLGGSNIDNIVIKEGDILENIPKPSKDGYEFVSWLYHNKEFDFNNPIYDNMIFVAKYKKIEEEKEVITIKFDTQGGSKIEDLKIEKGSIIKMPKEPAKSGYKFIGWYFDNKEFDFTKSIDKDITLIAKWEKE